MQFVKACFLSQQIWGWHLHKWASCLNALCFVSNLFVFFWSKYFSEKISLKCIARSSFIKKKKKNPQQKTPEFWGGWASFYSHLMLVHLASYFLQSFLQYSSLYRTRKKKPNKLIRRKWTKTQAQCHAYIILLLSHAFCCFAFSLICLYCRLLGPKPFAPWRLHE